jgi:GH25 family lysozyme M1 (1,4-beta-N-acetylmuramidase)
VIYGIDVSEYQGDFNFAQARKEGFTFVAVKCSGSSNAVKGTTYRDPWWRRSVAKVSAAEFPVRIGYHYLSGHDNTPFAQAGLLRDLTEEASIAQPWVACVDVEDKTVTAELMLDFFDAWEMIMGDEPLLVYTSPSFWKDKMGNMALPSFARLWSAHWVDEGIRFGTTGGKPTTPYSSQQAKAIKPEWWSETRGGLNPLVLQHTNHALVAGQWVDSSVSQQTVEQLAAVLT